MNLEQRLEELRVRLSLAQGTATLVILVAPTEAAVDENRTILADILRAGSLQIADLGRIGHDFGPAAWAEATSKQSADVYVMGAVPESMFGASAFATLVNGEREFLRRLPGPVLLVISRDTEDIFRKRAPDFLTWAATLYELPSAPEFLSMARRLGAAPTSSQRHKQEERPLRFLHLSDFHLRPGLIQRFDQDKVLRGLIEFLGRHREQYPLNAIFITGDMAFSGVSAEYELVTDFLEQLLHATGVLPERTFVVPGNHDVDRRIGKWLMRTLPDPKTADEFFLEEAARDAHARKFAAYRAAMASVLGEGRKFGLGVGKDAVEMLDWDETRIAVASFNSAWFAQADSDLGKLWLGEANVAEAGDRMAEEKSNFALALMHHPLEHLDEQERDNVEDRLERTFDVVLRGHLHKNRTKAIQSQRGGYIEVAGPAAYQTSQWPNGCFLGEIRPCARTIKLFPYRYTKGADPWVLDTTVFPNDAANGYTHTFEVPEKRIATGPIRRVREKAAVEVVQAMSPNVKQQMAQELGWHASAKKRLSPEVEQRIARKAATANEDTALWAKPEQAKKLDIAMGEAVVEEAFAKMPDMPKISPTDPKFLEKALGFVGRMIQLAPQHVMHGRSPAEQSVILNRAFAATLKRIVDGSVVARTRIESSSKSADIVIGSGNPPAKKALINVKMANSLLSFAPDLTELDYLLGQNDAAHGALVLAGHFGPEMKEPRIEHVRTSNGRDVLLMHLPLPVSSQ